MKLFFSFCERRTGVFFLLVWVTAGGLPQAVQGQSDTTNLPPHWQWQSPLPQGFGLIDLHTFNDSTALAVGRAGTVVKTIDYGRTWRVSNIGTLTDLTSVAFGNDLVGWAGYRAQPAAVHKTIDGGLTWNQQNLGLPEAATIRDIQFFSASEGYVLYYVGVNNSTELRYTWDGGQTWTLQSRLISGDPLTMQFVSPTVGYVVGGFFGLELLQKTINGGVTWQTVVPTTAQPQGYTSISFTDPNHGWVCGSNSTVYCTRNGGQSWQAQQLPNAVNRVAFADTLHGIAVGQFIYATSNGGQNWTFANFTDRESTSIQLRPSGAGWWLGRAERGGGGSQWQRTVNYGQHWTVADSIPAGTASQAQFFDATHGWLIKSRTMLARTNDRGSSWEAVDLSTKTSVGSVDWSLGFIQAMCFVDRDTGFVAVLDYGPGNIPRLFSLTTQNGGQTWTVTQQPALNLTIFQTLQPLVREMRFQSARRGMLVGEWGLIRRTIDGGQTWTTPAIPVTISRRRALCAIAWVDAQTVYVVGDSLTLLKSSDGGATFQSLPTPSNWGTFINNITFITPLVGLVGLGDRVARTIDGGQTWSFVTLPADQSVVRNSFFGFSFIDDRHGWAFGNDNVASTTDGGQTWTRTAIFSPYSYAVNKGVRVDRYNGWVASGTGNLIHYSEKFLTTTPLVQTTFCAGESLDVIFQREGSFGPTEQAVRVELSNAHGRFRPGEIRLLGLGTVSPIRVELPAGLVASALYRVRVIRADSSVLGSDNGQDLLVIPTPLQPLLTTLTGQVLQAALPANSPSPSRYEWEMDGLTVAGATTAQLTPGTSGTYRVRACSPTCCGPWSAPSAVVLTTKSATVQQFTLYPNPARTVLWLECPAGVAGATVEVIDVTGRITWKGTAGGGTLAVPVQQLAPGLYLVRLLTDAQPPVVGRVLVEH